MSAEILVIVLNSLLQIIGLSPVGERIIRIRDEDLSTRYSASCLVSLDEEQPTFVNLRDSSNTQVAAPIFED